MYWSDQGYLLSKTNFDENSIIIEVLTPNHGKYNGIVYGGLSKKQKRIFQIGNKILLNWKSKNENKMGYFSVELINPISPLFFDDKKKSICILAATSILKILLPERQINKKIYDSLDFLLNKLESNEWISLYINWEISLIKELGYSFSLSNKDLTQSEITINDKKYKIPDLLYKKEGDFLSKDHIREALLFNKNLFIDNFITPNKLKFPLSRNILERYYA